MCSKNFFLTIFYLSLFSISFISGQSTTTNNNNNNNKQAAPVVSCDANYLAAQGSFWSPNYNSKWTDPKNGGYPAYSKCKWTIKTTPGRYMRFGFFNTFDIEESRGCKFDYVAVYEGIEESEKVLLGRFCGIFPPPIMSSFSDSLTIEFRSDGGNSANGFLFSWQTYEFDSYANNLKNGECGGVITPNLNSAFGSDKEISGYVESPNYPKQPYTNNTYCLWKIDLSQNTKYKGVQIRVAELEIENAPSCKYDQVAIFNSTYIPSYKFTKTSLVKRWCEPGQKDEIYKIYGEQIYISFGTDGGNTAKGFRFYYDLIESDIDQGYLAKKYKPKKVWKPRVVKPKPKVVTTEAPKMVTETVKKIEVATKATIPVVVASTTGPVIMSEKKPVKTVSRKISKKPSKKQSSSSPSCPQTCKTVPSLNPQSEICIYHQFVFLKIRRIKKPKNKKKASTIYGSIQGSQTQFSYDQRAKKISKQVKIGKNIKIKISCSECLRNKATVVYMAKKPIESRKKVNVEEDERLTIIRSPSAFIRNYVEKCGKFF